MFQSLLQAILSLRSLSHHRGYKLQLQHQATQSSPGPVSSCASLGMCPCCWSLGLPTWRMERRGCKYVGTDARPGSGEGHGKCGLGSRQNPRVSTVRAEALKPSSRSWNCRSWSSKREVSTPSLNRMLWGSLLTTWDLFAFRMKNITWPGLDGGVSRDLPLHSHPQVTLWPSLSIAPRLVPTQLHVTKKVADHPPEVSPGAEGWVSVQGTAVRWSCDKEFLYPCRKAVETAYRHNSLQCSNFEATGFLRLPGAAGRGLECFILYHLEPQLSDPSQDGLGHKEPDGRT